MSTKPTPNYSDLMDVHPDVHGLLMISAWEVSMEPHADVLRVFPVKGIEWFMPCPDGTYFQVAGRRYRVRVPIEHFGLVFGEAQEEIAALEARKIHDRLEPELEAIRQAILYT